MPIYEYECKNTKCGLQFEVKRGFAEEENCLCPQCGSEAVRLFSPVPIIFKGSGFYVTDSHGKNCNLDKAQTSPPKKETKEKINKLNMPS